MDTFRKLTLGECRALREKCVPNAIPTMCVFTIKKDKQLTCWAIAKTVTGQKATVLRPFSGLIVSVSWLVGPSNRVITKMHSAQAFFWLRLRKQLYQTPLW